MSKFIDQVQAYNTDKRYASIEPIKISIRSQVDDFTNVNYYSEYRIEVRIGGSVKLQKLDALDQAKKVLMRSIQVNVFGEFRKHLYDLECYIYDRDFDKATECLKSIMNNMFSA